MAKKKLATCKGCGSSEALYVTLGNGEKLPSYVMKIGEGIFCHECAGESKKPETYLVTFEITSETDPAGWDWNTLLDLNVNESCVIHSTGQITHNNQREGN